MSQRMRISVIKEKYMRNFHKKIACTLTGVMLCGTLMGAVPVLAKDAEKYTNTDFAMDTVVSETLYTTGDDLNAEIGNKLREIESGLLSWTDEDSQISKLNVGEFWKKTSASFFQIYQTSHRHGKNGSKSGRSIHPDH